MSEVKVNKVTPRSGTTLTIGDSGDTTNVVGTLQNNGAALVGDISSVVAGTNLSGGGTSGAVTINLADASTSAKGASSFSSDNFAASSGAITIKDLGVATAEIQDDAVTLGKMAPGTDGNIISYDTSGNPVAVATGSAGQFLKSAGAGAVPSFATIPAGGKVLQVVSVAYPNLSQQTVTATSYTLIGGYVATITPAATSSKILVVGSAHFDSGGDGNGIFLAVYRYIGSGGYANPISYATDYAQTSDDSRENKTVPAWPYLDSPNTTSEIGYALHAKTSSGDTIYCNRKTLNITLIEIGA